MYIYIHKYIHTLTSTIIYVSRRQAAPIPTKGCDKRSVEASSTMRIRNDVIGIGPHVQYQLPAKSSFRQPTKNCSAGTNGPRQTGRLSR